MKSSHIIAKSSITLVAVIALISSTHTYAEARSQRTADVKLTHPLAKEVAESHHDTCARFSACGIDYPVLIQQALDGESNAIALLLLRHEVFPVDGAVAESFGQTRYEVIMAIGDEKLLAAFSFRGRIDWGPVRQYLLSWPNPEAAEPSKAEAEVKRRLPKFWAFLNNQGEGGAGQPATRSEADSEGGDKPQPESEGRSR